MKISIDTQTDSHAEIRKAIQLLQSLVGDKTIFTNDAESAQGMIDAPTPEVGNFMNMFDSPENAPEPEKKEPDNSGIQFY